MIRWVILLSLFSLGCSKQIRENRSSLQWIQEYTSESVRRIDIESGESKNYLMKVDVLLAEENRKGEPWIKSTPNDASPLPLLKLYRMNAPESSRVLLGEADHSMVFAVQYPVRLALNESIQLRLVHTKAKSDPTQPTAQPKSLDTVRVELEEVPFFDTTFIFKGQGRYIRLVGSALLSVTIEEVDRIFRF
jgi:hypothetical protein